MKIVRTDKHIAWDGGARYFPPSMAMRDFARALERALEFQGMEFAYLMWRYNHALSLFLPDKWVRWWYDNTTQR